MVFIMVLSVLFCYNNVYADPNSSKGYAEYDDAKAEKNYQEALEKQKNEEISLEGKSTDNYLESLSVEDYKISPEFDKQTVDYVIEEKIHSNEITITATPSNEKAKIEGIGKIKLVEGQKYCRIDVISETGTVRTYMIYFDEETKEEYTKIPEENSETEETSSVIENNKQNIFFTAKNIIIILAIILILITVFLLVKKKKRKKGKHY